MVNITLEHKTTVSKMIKHPQQIDPHSKTFSISLIVGYTLLLIYGTLFPFSGWQQPDLNILDILRTKTFENTSYTDIIINIMVYAPLGLLIARLLRSYLSPFTIIVATTVTGLIISLALEFIQIFVPDRVPSLIDLFLNGGGTLAGALLSVSLQDQGHFGKKLTTLRYRYFMPGKLVDLGLIILCLWALSQLSPLIPSPDIYNLRYGLKPLWITLHHLDTFNLAHTAEYVLTVTGLTLLTFTLIQQRETPDILIILFFIIVILLKVPVVSRQLSLEAFTGTIIGLFIAYILRLLFELRMPPIALVMLIASILFDGLRQGSDTDTSTHSINWIPFEGQMSGINGLADILDGIWPYMAIVYLIFLLKPTNTRQTMIIGGVVIVAISFYVEWMQQNIQGRYPDITDVILACIAWALPCLHPQIRKTGP